MFDVLEFEVRGAKALRPRVKEYAAISNRDVTTGMLRLDVTPDEKVIRDLRREPRIYVQIMKSKL